MSKSEPSSGVYRRSSRGQFLILLIARSKSNETLHDIFSSDNSTPKRFQFAKFLLINRLKLENINHENTNLSSIQIFRQSSLLMLFIAIKLFVMVWREC